MNNQEISKFIALILHHKPETIGISLDEHGWANVNDLIEGISKTYPLSLVQLESIVSTDNKGMAAFISASTVSYEIIRIA